MESHEIVREIKWNKNFHKYFYYYIFTVGIHRIFRGIFWMDMNFTPFVMKPLSDNLKSCRCLLPCAPIRCGTGIQNGQPHFRDHHADHAHFQQPQPPGRIPHAAAHLGAGLQSRDGPWEKQRGSGGTPGPASKIWTRTKEDQSRERLFSFGGSLPDPGLRQRPVLCCHHLQRGKDLQVTAHLWSPGSLTFPHQINGFLWWKDTFWIT